MGAEEVVVQFLFVGDLDVAGGDGADAIGLEGALRRALLHVGDIVRKCRRRRFRLGKARRDIGDSGNVEKTGIKGRQVGGDVRILLFHQPGYFAIE